MESSPCRPRLYRTTAWAVTLVAVAFLVGQSGWAQFVQKPKVDLGPRALGLIQLGNNGKGRLIPVAIMLDGKFYDAAAYKATPVPMALDFGIVYEGFRTGVSQGLFTIKQPGQLNRTWIAEGTWLPTGAKPPETRKKAEAPVIEEKDAPPRLHRGDPSAAKPADKPGEKTGDETADKSGDQSAAKSADKTADQKPATSAPASDSSAKPSEPPAKSTVAEDRSPDDPNRPTLRRGKPDPASHPERMKVFDEPDAVEGAKTPVAKNASSSSNPAQLIPAISDVGGPDPRPYTYDIKPAEEATYRAKMLDLASTQLAKTISDYSQGTPAAPARAGRKTPATPKAGFDDVHLRIFDLSNSNEPVLILSAKTQLAKNAAGNAIPKEITLIARTNLEGDLHKLFFSATDAHLLDITPRMELIDAVDADGDGRGELLFRRTFESGSAYAIYRATADQLWPLFEGNP